MKKILVFGGAGYIGSHTCLALAAKGYQPVVFDNLCEGHREFVRWGELIEADILDQNAISSAFQSVKPAAAVHFAALAYVGESVLAPAKYYRTNVVGSLNIVEQARCNGNVPIVFSSSCATYGDPKSLPIVETTRQEPISPYGRTKLVAEQILSDYDSAYGLPHVCLRYFNACGDDPDLQIGERHHVETHIIPRAILSALGKLDDFMIFGGDYDTPDGSPVRDYVHVLDLAQAHVLAIEHLLNGGPSEQFNIGSGTGVSVFELVAALERIIGRSVPLSIAPRRPGDPPILVADTSKAKQILGFSAQHSGLDTILQTAIAWHRNEVNRAK
jgi:UDP-arabinose 4-epimerase